MGCFSGDHLVNFEGPQNRLVGYPELREVLLPTQAETVCFETMRPIISA